MPLASANHIYRAAILIDVAGLSGSARVALQHSSLAPKEFDITLFIISRDNCNLSELLETADDLQVKYRIIHEKNFLDTSVFSSLYKILKSENFSLVESNHYKTHLLALVISRILKIPWVAVSHGWTSEDLKVKFYNFLDLISLNFASINIAVSNSIARKINSTVLFNRRALVIPTALDPRSYQNESCIIKSETKCLNLISVGRLSYEKGFDLLLKACAVLRNKKIDFSLNIIGDGPELKNLQKLSEELGLSQQVIFSGQQKSEQVQSCIKTSDCLIIASRAEGLPNTLLEAMWFKTPVISCKVGEIATVLKDYDQKLLVMSKDIKQFATAIEYFHNLSFEQRQKLSESLNKTLHKKHLAKRRTAKVFRIYRKLLSRRTS